MYYSNSIVPVLFKLKPGGLTLLNVFARLPPCEFDWVIIFVLRKKNHDFPRLDLCYEPLQSLFLCAKGFSSFCSKSHFFELNWMNKLMSLWPFFWITVGTKEQHWRLGWNKNTICPWLSADHGFGNQKGMARGASNKEICRCPHWMACQGAWTLCPALWTKRGKNCELHAGFKDS